MYSSWLLHSVLIYLRVQSRFNVAYINCLKLLSITKFMEIMIMSHRVNKSYEIIFSELKFWSLILIRIQFSSHTCIKFPDIDKIYPILSVLHQLNLNHEIEFQISLDEITSAIEKIKKKTSVGPHGLLEYFINMCYTFISQRFFFTF